MLNNEGASKLADIDFGQYDAISKRVTPVAVPFWQVIFIIHSFFLYTCDFTS